MKIRTALLAAALVTGALLTGAAPATAAPVTADAAAVTADTKAVPGIGKYNVTFRTGDLANADTWDYVRLTAWGDLAKLGPLQFNRDFQRGETHTFGPYSAPVIGKVGYISLYKSGNESDAWYVEYVQIHEEHSGALYTCRLDRWMPQNASTVHVPCS